MVLRIETVSPTQILWSNDPPWPCFGPFRGPVGSALLPSSCYNKFPKRDKYMSIYVWTSGGCQYYPIFSLTVLPFWWFIRIDPYLYLLHGLKPPVTNQMLLVTVLVHEIILALQFVSLCLTHIYRICLKLSFPCSVFLGCSKQLHRFLCFIPGSFFSVWNLRQFRAWAGQNLMTSPGISIGHMGFAQS